MANIVFFLTVPQRATLAEKEVSALKEQLAVANQNSLSDSKMAAGAGEDVNRSSIQVELSAKDKEVPSPSIIFTIYIKKLSRIID